MKKTLVILFLTTMAFLTPVSLFADYDKDAVVKTMKVNLAQVGALKKALDAKDFAGANVAFKEIVKAAEPMKAYTPKKGTKADWDSTWNAFIIASLKGSLGALEKDATAVKTQFDALMALNKSGHAAFK